MTEVYKYNNEKLNFESMITTMVVGGAIYLDIDNPEIKERRRKL